MNITTGFLAASLLVLGISLWRLVHQRRGCIWKSRVIAATNCSVVVTDATVPRHPIIYVNPAFRLLTGYSDDDVLSESLSLLNGPQTDRGVIERLAVAIQEGRAYRTVARHYRKSGTTFWNEITLSPVKNRAGLVTEYLWVMSDVTLRRQSEEALTGALDSSRRLADLMPQGVVVTNDSGIVYANTAGLTFLSVETLDQTVGKPIRSFFDPETSDIVRRCLDPHVPCASASHTTGWLLRGNRHSVQIRLSAASIHWEGKASCLLLISQAIPVIEESNLTADRTLAHLKSAQAIAHLGSWEWDISSGAEVWSEEQYRIFGYEPGSITPTYDTFKDALHPDDRDRILTAVEHTLDSDSPYDIECRIIRPSGDIRFVRCRGLVSRDSVGRPIRMAGTVQDVTESKLLEAVAKDRDLQFQQVVESAPCGMLMVSQEGTVTLANVQIEKTFGYAREELLGRSVELLLPERFRPAHSEHQRAFLVTLPPRAKGYGRELFGLRKDGTEVPLEIELTPIQTSSGTMTLASVVDITTRCQTDRALREHQERFDLVVQAAQVGIYEHDHRTDSLYWSPILRSMYGVSNEEVSSLQRYVELIHQADRGRVLQAIRQAHDPTGDGRVSVEHRIVRPDGSLRNVALHSLTRFDGEGASRTPTCTIGMVVDITDRIKAETYLRNSSKMEAIGTLAGGIAHEFNNSLTAVLGFSELALPMVPTSSKAHRHIQQVIIAGRKSRDLVHQLLTFSRQSDQHRCPLLLHVLVKESLKLLRPMIPSWIELREQIATSTSPISANTTQLHQMILNLVEHALHAMRKSGGVLEFQLQDREFAADQVTPSGRLPAGYYVCLTVRDSGEGMEPDVAGRMFDPFFTTRPLGEGRMGLCIVHGIVTAHGGEIVIDSGTGVGSTISVYLPALPPRASSATTKDEPLPRGHECILFVDDEESLARCGGEMLQSLGYYPVVRTNGAEAWQAFQVAPQRFDLLITDWAMPGLNGDLLARECRRLRPELPVILCTGSNQAMSAHEARLLGITELVLKPLTMCDLAHTIRRVLDQSLPVVEGCSEPSGPAQGASLPPTEESDAVGPRR